MDIERIKKKVLEKYAPEKDELEELNSVYNEVAEFIEKNYDVDTHFAGSASRETCLKGDKDIDIFLLFPDTVEREELEEKGLEIGRKVFKKFNSDHRVEYAEHPYTKGQIKGHEVDLVPCYDLEAGKVKSSVDRTPHHTRWVENNLSNGEKEDVVILKALLKNSGLYGSSLKVRGFSGYLCEVLISHYGSFEDLIEKAAEWREKKLIDPENHHGGHLDGDLEEKFRDESLKVIDPVDPERNVASVLSIENYAKFIHLAIEFGENPGMNYFREPNRQVSRFEIEQELDKRAHMLVMEFESPEEVEDIVYPQMRKAIRALNRVLEEEEFRIYEKGFHVAKRARIYFEIDPKLPDISYVKGPKVFHGKEHIQEFKSKYNNTFIKNDRLFAKTERKFTDVKDLIHEKMENPHKVGVPENISEKIKNFSFEDPLDGNSEWLKHLAEELKIRGETDD